METKGRQNKSRIVGKQRPTSTSITCGKDNPSSLRCVFYELESGELAAPFCAKHIHEGHRGVMHGGLSAAIIDETMGRSNAVYHKKTGRDYIPVVTAQMTTKYIKPIYVGEPMVAYGRVIKEEGRKRFATGEIINEKGEVVLEAEALFITVDLEMDRAEVVGQHEICQLSAVDPLEL
ncbi:MAG: PaaI family thioesterase [Firmicutes bacterium]|nr:PaaI family thioesterase [Bacillota bacterium]MBR1989764.1 PaaI family thioesterase [Bacillota bacterium]